jgi:hypothetical protein
MSLSEASAGGRSKESQSFCFVHFYFLLLNLNEAFLNILSPRPSLIFPSALLKLLILFSNFVSGFGYYLLTYLLVLFVPTGT